MIEYLPLVLTGIGIIVSILYYTSVLQNANQTRKLQLRAQELAIETRQAQLFMQIFQEFSSVENFRIMRELTAMEWEDYDDFMRKYSGETNPEAFAMRYSHQYRFDGIGVLVKAGLIDLERVHDLMWTFIVWNWDKYGEINLKHREVFNNPDYMAGYEYLVNELKKMRIEKGFSPDVPDNLMSTVAQNRSET
jgi:hypothetical protein